MYLLTYFPSPSFCAGPTTGSVIVPSSETLRYNGMVVEGGLWVSASLTMLLLLCSGSFSRFSDAVSVTLPPTATVSYMGRCGLPSVV